MANALFGGSVSTEEKPLVQTRRTSRAPSVSFIRRASQAEGTSHLPAHGQFIHEALAEARASLAEGGIPNGCVLVRNGQVIGRGRNRRIQRGSVISHAVMHCLEAAGRQPAAFYRDCTLYTTLSPCSMCSGAIRLYGIPRVVIGENKTFQGDETILRASNVHVDVLDSQECYDLLESYIKENSLIWYEDIGHQPH
jgi:creatinine deaminase